MIFNVQSSNSLLKALKFILKAIKIEKLKAQSFLRKKAWKLIFLQKTKF